MNYFCKLIIVASIVVGVGLGKFKVSFCEKICFDLDFVTFPWIKKKMKKVFIDVFGSGYYRGRVLTITQLHINTVKTVTVIEA